jgi:hypothetical protein
MKQGSNPFRKHGEIIYHSPITRAKLNTDTTKTTAWRTCYQFNFATYLLLASNRFAFWVMLKDTISRYQADYSPKTLIIKRCISVQALIKRLRVFATRGINRMSAHHNRKSSLVYQVMLSALSNGVQNGKNANQCDSERRNSCRAYQR